MTGEFTEIERQTKAIYVEQHKAYVQDMSIFDRFYRVAAQPSTYDLPDDYFRGKQVIDVGCGNTAYFQKAMYDLGAHHVTCVDIGEAWMPELETALTQLDVPRNFYTMLAGSGLRLPCPDASFDFVASNGVMMHLEGLDQAEQAFAEHARVTKPGGSFYIYVGHSGGLVDRYILDAARKAYREMPGFKAYIDGLTPDRLHEDLDGIVAIARQHDPEIEGTLRAMSAMLTLDTITFWQNALQVPVQQGGDLTESWARKQFARHNFEKVRKVAPVYWQRNDIRRFLAPFHYATSNPISQILYGGGHVKMIGEKA